MLAVVAVVGLDVEAGDGEVKVVVLGQGHHVGEHRGLHPVVTVDEVHKLAGGTVEREVAGRRSALVGRMDDVDADVALGKPVGHLTGAVGGSVVDDEQLEVAQRLVLEALDGTTDEAVHVVGRDDDRDLGNPLHPVRHSATLRTRGTVRPTKPRRPCGGRHLTPS